MTLFGRLLFFTGLVCVLLHYAGIDIPPAAWFGSSGAGTGNMLRAALLIVGGVVWFLGKRAQGGR